MGDKKLEINKKSADDAVIRNAVKQDAPQVMRNRVLEGQQVNQGQHAERQAPGAEELQTAENNHMIRLKAAAIGVKTDTRFFGDSYRMGLIKASIDRMHELQGVRTEQETDFDSLKVRALDIYSELIRECDEYLTARKKEGKTEQTGRYKKVQELRESTSKGLKQLACMSAGDFRACFRGERQTILFGKVLERDAAHRSLETPEAKELIKAEQTKILERNHAGLDQYKEFFEGTGSDRQITELLGRYGELRDGLLPDDAESFLEGKDQLISVCDQILRESERIASAGAFLKKNKVRREYAYRLRTQMVWEKERLSNTGFDRIQSYEGMTWDRIWEGSMTEIKFSDAEKTDLLDNFRQDSALYMKNAFYEKNEAGQRGEKLAPEFAGLEGQKGSVGCRGSFLMSKILGEEALFASYKEVTIVGDKKDQLGKNGGYWTGDTEKGYLSGEKGVTLMKALEDAKELGEDLVYSIEAIKQLTRIQIMDMICGQVNRSDDSLKVRVTRKAREGRNYVVIENVMAVKNEYSFGTARFEDLNKDGSGSSLRLFFDQEKNFIKMGAYDPDFAEKVLSLDPDEVIRQFDDIGLGNEQKEALKDRLTGVQYALRLDKRNPDSVRGKLEDYRIREHYYDSDPPLTDQQKRELDAKSGLDSFFEEQFSKGARRNSYVNPALIKDVGNTEELTGMSFDDGYWDVSSANEYVDEEKLNSQKIRNERTAAVRKIVSEEVENSDKIPEDSVHYKIVFMMEQYAALDVTAERAVKLQKKGRTMKEILDNLQGFKIDEPLRTKLQKMNVTNGLPSLEGHMVKIMKDLIENRLQELRGKQKNEQELYEEQQMEKYLELISDSTGLLEVPEKVTMEEEGLTLLDTDNKVLEAKDLRDAKDEVLFPHPPCIQDLMQGKIGDCYLIGCLSAVVEKDPSFIKKHMRDEGNTVTVKLYNKEKPVFVRVNKTVYAHEDGKSRGAKGSLWVQMYEKAVMISGLLNYDDHGELTDDFKDLQRKNQRSYSMYKSSNPGIVLPVITGKEAHMYFSDGDLLAPGIDLKNIKKDSRVLLNNGTIGYSDTFNVKENVKRMGDIIRETQKKNGIMTASTRKNYIQSNPVGKRRKESEERGLYTGHTYTLIGMETINKINYVRLRNPWGHGAVLEIRNPLTGQVAFRKAADRFGTFVIDMKSFVTYFSCISTSSL